MSVKKLLEKVYLVGAKHPDRRLFDELIPLPEGTSYNSYIVEGSEKTVLIDTVDPALRDQLFGNLKRLGIKKIDYIIANHAEQDHSGSIPFVLEAYPGAKLVTNEKCAGMLKDFALVTDERLLIIKEGETLPLGDKTLEFMLTPWVHWPETMCTYLKEDGVLFSCDFFGSHVAASNLLDSEHFYKPAKRYFAEIMSPFRNNVRNNIQKLDKFKINMICPSHGYIHSKPEKILNAYKEWSSEELKNEVLLAYVSMHDSTRKMAEHLKDALEEKGIVVHYFNLPLSDLGEIAMALMDAATVILGGPTVLVGLHPVVVNAAYIANALRPKTKFASWISSYSWAEKSADVIKSILTNFKGEILSPVISKGYPKEAEFAALDKLAEDIAQKHKGLGLMG
jgi:flavorubredoxin